MFAARNIMMTATGIGPPTVTSVSVTSTAAGTTPSVTITGTNFIAGATVSVGGTAATSVVVNSLTSITCTFPSKARGTYAVSVTTGVGTGTLNSAISYTQVATLSSISPTSGTEGVKSFTLTGTGFSIGGANAYFNPIGYATAVTVNSDTSMTVTSPSLTAGTISVAAINSDGWSEYRTYTCYGVPTISSFSTIPYGGSSGSVTITGTNFYSGATVSVGGTAATSVVVNSTTSITCTFPAKATGTYAVTVTSLGGTSAGVNATYSAPPVVPTVSSVSPSSTTTASQTYTVYGTGFNASGTLAIQVDGGWIPNTYATILSDSAANFTYAGTAGAHSITVYNYSGGYSNTLANAFTCIGAPTLSSVSPNSGLAVAGGTTLTLTGTNFLSGMTATIGGTAVSTSVSSTTSATCTAPAKTGTNTVTVTTGSGTSSGVSITYQPAPTLSSCSPTSGVAGSTTTLTGSNFVVGGTTCSVSGTAATISVSSTTSATVTIPSITAGAKTISVTTSGGTSGTVAYTVTVPAPTISSVSDSRSGNGALTGSTITVSGSNFTGASVTVGGTAVTASVSASSISFTCPNLGTDGTKAIVVTTSGGSASSSLYFWAAKSAVNTTYTSGSGTYTPPQWANYLDVAIRGGGGSGGGSSVTAWGGGGSAGAGAGGTISLVSAGWGARSYSVGNGGAGVGSSVAGKAGGTTTAAGYSAAGGAGGGASNNGPAGTGTAQFTVRGAIAPAATGGAAGTSAQPGANPGSGGGGGNSALGPYNGIAGRAGAVYFSVRQ